MTIHRRLLNQRRATPGTGKPQPGRKPKPSFDYVKVDAVSVKENGIVLLDTTGGGRFVFEPKSVTRIIPGRLRYSEATYKAHEELVRNITRRDKCPHDSPELACFLAPALATWAVGRKQLDVLELGPAHTTDVPDALASVVSSYTAVDFSLPFLRKQRELLAETPELLARCRYVVADTYELTLPPSSSDLVVVSCHPPLVSASIEDKCMVIDKIHKFLKPGGTLTVFPWHFDEQQVEVNRHVLSRFKLQYIAFQEESTKRLLLFLEKR